MDSSFDQHRTAFADAYVAHVIIGLAPLQLLRVLENGSVMFTRLYTFLFYGDAIVFSVYWKKTSSSRAAGTVDAAMGIS